MNGKRSRFTIIDDADLPDGIEWVAVDLASGPDRTARVRGRYSEADGFTVEEIDFPNVTSREQAERMARRDDLCPHGLRLRGAFCLDCATASPDLADAFAHMAGANPYARTRSAGPAGASYMVEVITDPNDRRGFDARPVRAA